MSANTVDLLLKSGDCIHAMLEGHEQGSDVDTGLQNHVSDQLNALLGESVNGDTDASSSSALNDVASDASEQADWQVKFEPHAEMFFSGNDPLRILRELKELHASCVISADASQLPDIEDIEAELCYLKWTAHLPAEVAEDDIREIFEWVEDECDLVIERILPVSNECDAEKQQPIEGDPVSPVAHTTASNHAKSDPKPSKIAKSESSVSSIRVDIDKVDSLINLVGELVITQSMLTEIGNDFAIDKLEKLKAGLAQLLQNSKDLQENVLNIRMLPMSFAFSRFPRLVRDLSSRLDKQVDLEIQGEHRAR